MTIELRDRRGWKFAGTVLKKDFRVFAILYRTIHTRSPFFDSPYAICARREETESLIGAEQKRLDCRFRALQHGRDLRRIPSPDICA